MKIHESAENYLETILRLQMRNGQVRAIDIAKRSSQCQRVVQNKESGVIIAHADLFGAAHHAAGFNTAKFGFLDLEFTFFTLEDSADGGKRHDLAGITIRGSADHLTGLFAVKDLTDREVI